MKKFLINFCFAFLLIIATILPFFSNGQSNNDLIIPRSHEMDGVTYYMSGKGKYILTRGSADDYFLWDVKSGKQFATIVTGAKLSSYVMYYNAQPVFSNDEKLLLIPVNPNGSYILYDIINARVIREIPPQSRSRKFTRAFFSPDSKTILLIEHQIDDMANSYLEYFSSAKGELLSEAVVKMPFNLNDPDYITRIVAE